MNKALIAAFHAKYLLVCTRLHSIQVKCRQYRAEFRQIRSHKHQMRELKRQLRMIEKLKAKGE